MSTNGCTPSSPTSLSSTSTTYSFSNRTSFSNVLNSVFSSTYLVINPTSSGGFLTNNSILIIG